MKVKRFSRSEIKITKPVIKFKSPSKKEEEDISKKPQESSFKEDS